MKKQISILLAFSLLLSLWGCGMAEAPPEPEISPEPTPITLPLPSSTPEPTPEPQSSGLSLPGIPETPELWLPNCEDFITLRRSPDGEALAYILKGSEMELLAWDGRYARVAYDGKEGYVLANYIMPAEENYPESRLSTVEPCESYSYEQLLEDMAELAEKFPETAVLDSIGLSEEGRDIPLLRLGSGDARYHVLIQGSIHGREHMCSWLLMAMADHWLSQGPGLFTDICWHIIPMSNPDGVIISQRGVLSEEQKEIHLRDRELGQGYADEAEYASQWKANGLGTDLNRNFPSGWDLKEPRSEPSSEMYRGEEPFSAAESAALRDYTEKYPFDLTLSYHASGSVIYWQYGSREPANSLSYSLACALEDVSSYGPLGSKNLDGAGYKDWAIDALGIPSLTVEIGSGVAPLEERELNAVFARNIGFFPVIARWLIDPGI